MIFCLRVGIGAAAKMSVEYAYYQPFSVRPGFYCHCGV